MGQILRRIPGRTRLAALGIVAVVAFSISIFVGRYPVSVSQVVKILLSMILPITQDWSATVETVVLRIRLPRAMVAMFVGAALAISGASFQGMFKNPLVSPDILGVSSSAGFGAALAILGSRGEAEVLLFAFLFGIGGVLLTYLISRIYRTTTPLMLVLSGIVVSAFFSALISAVKYVADPFEKLPAITFWLMGSFAATSAGELLATAPPILAGTVGLVAVGWRINVLSMGDEEARALGVRTELLKGYVITCSTVVTASAVCVSGIIGWVGLVIPHIGRIILGPDHRSLLPASALIGATYLLLVDNLARSISSSEIPLGILTAIVGAPFFAYLIRKTRGNWK